MMSAINYSVSSFLKAKLLLENFISVRSNLSIEKFHVVRVSHLIIFNIPSGFNCELASHVLIYPYGAFLLVSN